MYTTPTAAKILNDKLDKVQGSGIEIVSEDEADALGDSIRRIEFREFNLLAIQKALAPFGIDLSELDAIEVAVSDHDNPPASVSDRQFRFDYLDERIQENSKPGAKKSLSAFAYLSDEFPPIMTRTHLNSIILYPSYLRPD